MGSDRIGACCEHDPSQSCPPTHPDSTVIVARAVVSVMLAERGAALPMSPRQSVTHDAGRYLGMGVRIAPESVSGLVRSTQSRPSLAIPIGAKAPSGSLFSGQLGSPEPPAQRGHSNPTP